MTPTKTRLCKKERDRLERERLALALEGILRLVTKAKEVAREVHPKPNNDPRDLPKMLGPLTAAQECLSEELAKLKTPQKAKPKETDNANRD